MDIRVGTWDIRAGTLDIRVGTLDIRVGTYDNRVGTLTCANHSDHAPRMLNEIDQKTKVDQNTRFFLRFFSPAHFDHWKLR